MIDPGQPFVSSKSRTSRYAWLILLPAMLIMLVLSGWAGAAVVGRSIRQASVPRPAESQKTSKSQRAPANPRLVRASTMASLRFSQSGVQCEGDGSQDAIQACAGKNAGDTC